MNNVKKTKGTKTQGAKIWLLGHVRDYDKNYEAALSKDIADYFEDKFADRIPVKVFNLGNYLSINIGLRCGDNIEKDTIPQSIGLLLFGENKNFKPKATLPSCPSFGYINCQVPFDDFLQAYKQNARYYGATPVKKVEIVCSDSIGLIVRLIY